MSHNTTIAAIATPPGKGGVGIIRVSGLKVPEIARQILGFLPKPRHAKHARFFNEKNETIDQGLALYFPAPNSFTGEDVLELHGHGGPVIQDCLLRVVLQAGACLARPGEFSERAFLNNKLDLSQAEAIADLIDAGSEQAARAAMRSLQGEFSQKINNVLEKLIHLRLYIEAALDFPEEEIEFLRDQKIQDQLQNVIQELRSIFNTAKQGSLLREGMNIVIAGPPNAGKSSLLNALSGRETAIVTDIPGTTRDVLRDIIQIDGLPLHVIDTAGLRESNDQVEQEGIRRTFQEIERADRILLVIDSTNDQTISELKIAPNHAKKITIIRNKIDLLKENPVVSKDSDQITISLSVKTGAGLDLLKEHLKTCLGFEMNTEGNFSARRRHLDALTRAEQAIVRGHSQLCVHRAGELLAEDLRQAQQALGEITGEFTADDLLGKIFSSFCIGK